MANTSQTLNPLPVETPWLKIKEAAAYSRKSKSLISDALRCGELRGNQTKANGTWLVHRDDLDAWIRGERADVHIPSVSRRRPA